MIILRAEENQKNLEHVQKHTNKMRQKKKAREMKWNNFKWDCKSRQAEPNRLRQLTTRQWNQWPTEQTLLRIACINFEFD